MTFQQISRQRLINQQIAGAQFKTAREMVSWLGAVQAQEYAHAKWAMGLRLPHLTDSDVEKDLTKGNILRTHLLRPTWHFVTAEDIRWMLQLSAPRVHAMNAFMYRKMALDNAIFKRCHRLIAKSLEGNNQLTRNEINSIFRQHKIETDTVRLSCIMMHAELDGLICSGPRKGNQFTYALLEERVPKAPKKTKEEALIELTERYFKSRGPATVKDFATWSGLTLADCKNGVGLLELKRDTSVDEQLYYYSDLPTTAKPFNGMCLLPIYDEMIMGYKDRSVILQYSVQKNVDKGFVFDNTILYKGQIVGTWKRTIKSKSVELSYNFLSPPTKTELAAFKKAVEGLERFIGLKITATGL